MRFDVRHLPPRTAGRLGRFYALRQLMRMGRVVFGCLAMYIALLLVAMHVDRFVFLDPPTRQLMATAVHAVVGLIAIVSLVVLMVRRPTTRQIAYELEARLGSAEERYVTLDSILAPRAAISTAAGGATEQLTRQLRSATEALSRSAEQVWTPRDIVCRNLMIVALAMAALLGLLALPESYQLPLMLQRFYEPTTNLPRASFIDLQLTPGDTVVGRGGEVVIQARIDDRTPAGLGWLMEMLGASPRGATIEIEPAGDELGETVRMARAQRELFLFTRSGLETAFDYTVRTGNAASKRRQVSVVRQPRITAVQVTITPPGYTGLEPRTIDDPDSALRLFLGAKVDISYRADQSIEEAWVSVEDADERVDAPWDAERERAVYQFTPTDKTVLDLHARNTRGFANVDRRQVTLAVQEDMPPRVTLNYPPAELEAVASELVPVEVRVEDDLGVESVRLSYVVNPDPMAEPVRQSLPVTLEQSGVAQLTTGTALDLAKLGVGPGDRVRMQVRSRDAAGNEGISRDVEIRVVPFTRGAHEQRRITALRFLAQALGQLASGGSEAIDVAVGAKIDVATWDAITTAASASQVPLPTYPSVDSLLALIEVEHFLTVRPNDQRDLRHLAGIVRAAAEPELFDSPETAAAYRKARFTELTNQLIGPLVRYRQARNLMWRLYGMQREALRLRDELTGLTPEEAPRALTQLQRWSKLYLDALQNLGADLQQLADQTEALDAQTLRDAFGEINTAGYFMGRGGLSRRRASAEAVAEQLRKVITTTEAVLPVLLVDHVQARRELAAMYTNAVAHVAAPAAASEPVDRWLAADGAMLRQSATSATIDQLLRHRLREAIAAGDDARRAAAAQQLVQSLGDPDPAVVDTRRLARAVGKAWLLERTSQSRPLSDPERTLERTLIELEYRAPTDRESAVEQFTARLNAAQPASPGASAMAASRQITTQAAAALGDPQRTTAERLSGLQQTLHEAQESIASVREAIDAAEASVVLEQARRLDEALARQRAASQLFLASILDRLTRLPGSAATDTDALDALLLRWREAMERYQLATERTGAMASLQRIARGEEDPEMLAGLAAELEILQRLHRALVDQLGALAEQYADGDLTTDEQVASELLRSTERLARMLLGEGGLDRASAEAVMSEMEVARRVWAAAHQRSLAEAFESITEAERLVGTESIDAAQVKERLEASADLLGEVAQGLATAAADDEIARLSQRIRPIADRLTRAAREDLSQPEAVSRVRFAVDAMLPEVESLVESLRQLAEGGTSLRFTGGPTADWAAAYDQDIRHVQQGLTDLATFARHRSLLAALAPLGEHLQTPDVDEGYAWAALVHRMIRSPLFRSGGVRSQGRGEAREDNALIRFLERELSEAKQQGDMTLYHESTRRYLELIGDYLKY